MKVLIKWLFVIGLIASKSVCAESEVIIYGADNKPPKIYLDGETPRGILIEILHYIDSQLVDYRFTIELYPFPRAYRYALSGTGGIIGLSKNLERQKVFHYSDTVYVDEVVVVTKEGNEFPFARLSDLNGKYVSVGLGGSYGQEFEEAKRAGLIHFIEDTQQESSMHKLLAGRVDCMLINPGTKGLEYLLSHNERLGRHSGEFSVLPIPFAVDPNFLGFSKKMEMQPFLKSFNRVIEQGLKSGKIQKIIRDYGASSKQ